MSGDITKANEDFLISFFLTSISLETGNHKTALVIQTASQLIPFLLHFQLALLWVNSVLSLQLQMHAYPGLWVYTLMLP